jgi:hypothetical protein
LKNVFVFQMASRKRPTFISRDKISEILNEDDDDLVDPLPSDHSEDEEAPVVDRVDLVFGEDGVLIQQIHTGGSDPDPDSGEDSDYQEEQEGPSRRKRRRIPVPMRRRRIEGIILKITVLRILIRIRCLFHPWVRDPGWVKIRI